MTSIARVGVLALLVLAPRTTSPEPSAPSTAFALVAVALLGVGLGVSAWLMRRFDVLEAKAAVALWVLAGAALFYGAHSTEVAGRPLLSAYYLAAPPTWAALAATLATLAGQYLGVRFKNKRMGAAIVTLAIGIFVFRDAHAYIASSSEQWREALRREPAHARAWKVLSPELAKQSDFDEKLQACVAAQPDACLCRVLRAERALDRTRADAALEEAGAARCSDSESTQRLTVSKAMALALVGRDDEATELIDAGLAVAPEDGRLFYARALVASKRGRTDDAIADARASIEHGGPADASFLLGVLQLQKGDRVAAKQTFLAYVATHPNNAKVTYNLALIAEQDGDYNGARNGYLAALNLDPTLRDARYNLALLTLRFGFKAEAQHHAQKFAAVWPDDDRVAGLLARVGLPAP
ncbi:MAG: hypothetical protein U0271_41010 [Polyangiaceae bacterium]